MHFMQILSIYKLKKSYKLISPNHLSHATDFNQINK